MKTIYKYPIEVIEEQALTLPIGAKILTVQMQGTAPCIWAMIDKAETNTEKIIIRIHGTGNPIAAGDELIYVGTFQMHDGQVVFHTFYKHNE